MPFMTRSTSTRKLLYYLGVVFQVGGPLVAIDYRDNGLLAWAIALGGFSAGTLLMAVTGNLSRSTDKQE